MLRCKQAIDPLKPAAGDATLQASYCLLKPAAGDATLQASYCLLKPAAGDATLQASYDCLSGLAANIFNRHAVILQNPAFLNHVNK